MKPATQPSTYVGLTWARKGKPYPVGDGLISEVSRSRVSLIINYTLSPDISNCTVTLLNLTTSVSCSNTTLNISEYQVIILK